jgi:hypothetical protein
MRTTKVLTNCLSHGGDDLPSEAQSVLQRPAILIVAAVGMGREELMNQVAVAEGYLNGFEACLPHPPGSLSEIADVSGNLVKAQRPWHNAVGRAEHIGGGDPFPFGHQFWVGDSPGVVDMGHYVPTCLVHRIHQAAQAIHQAVLVNTQLGWQLTPIGVDVHRLCGDQSDATLSPPHVECYVTVGNVALGSAIARFDSGHQHPVR